MISMAAAPPATIAAPPTRDQLRATLKQLWDSIETLEFRTEEYNAGKDGVPDPSRGYSRFEFAMGSGARRALKSLAIRPDGEQLMEDVREDGKKQYGIQWAPDGSGVINQLSIRNQADTSENYSGGMSHPMYLLMPFGKPLHVHIDEGAAVEPFKDPDGKERIAVVFKARGNDVRNELDESHDWLPRRQLIAGVSDMVVTRFERADGRWFPVEGKVTDMQPERYLVFKVSNLRLNGPLPKTTFDPTSLKTKGTLVVDSTKRGARVVGGMEARKRFEEEHLPRPKPSSGPLTASPDPDEFPWRTVILVGSIGVILAGLLVAFRQGRHRS